MARVRTCGSEEARQRLPELLERARRGSVTVITRHGKPYAALVPAERVRTQRRGISLLALRGTGKGLWGPSPSDEVRAQRDEWE